MSLFFGGLFKIWRKNNIKCGFATSIKGWWDCLMFCTFIRVSVCNITAHLESQNLRWWAPEVPSNESNPLPNQILYSRLHRSLKPFATAWQRYKFKARVAAESATWRCIALHLTTVMAAICLLLDGGGLQKIVAGISSEQVNHSISCCCPAVSCALAFCWVDALSELSTDNLGRLRASARWVVGMHSQKGKEEARALMLAASLIKSPYLRLQTQQNNSLGIMPLHE